MQSSAELEAALIASRQRCDAGGDVRAFAVESMQHLEEAAALGGLAQPALAHLHRAFERLVFPSHPKVPLHERAPFCELTQRNERDEARQHSLHEAEVAELRAQVAKLNASGEMSAEQQQQYERRQRDA